MEKIKNILEITCYNKGGATWYADYYFYNGKAWENGTTRASGYGYDKHSTAISNAINKYKNLYKIKRGTKWESETSAHAINKNHTFYGVYKDKTISYGIGFASVVNCLGVFSNVKILQQYNGRYETFLKLEITTNESEVVE